MVSTDIYQVFKLPDRNRVCFRCCDLFTYKCGIGLESCISGQHPYTLKRWLMRIASKESDLNRVGYAYYVGPLLRVEHAAQAAD